MINVRIYSILLAACCIAMLARVGITHAASLSRWFPSLRNIFTWRKTASKLLGAVELPHGEFQSIGQ